MEFKIRTAGASLDLDAVEQNISAIDPAAIVDLDATGTMLRVSALIDEARLIAIVNQAGLTVGIEQLERVPSVCCGGCGG